MSIFGKKILCTRPKEGSEEFRKILESAGAECLIIQMIEILPFENTNELDSKLEKLHQYSGIIFTSANGVKHFFSRADQRGIKPANKIFAVGEKTRSAIENSGFKVTFIPESSDSSSLAKMLKENGGEDSSYLFPKGNLSMKQLVTDLKNVDEVIVYETHKPMKNQSLTELESLLNNKEINCIAFFSPSAVTNFTELYPLYKNTGADIAAIGKTTLERINKLGLEAKIVAKKATAENLGEEIINYYNAG